MTRRDLIALLGSTATMWPLAARAQQPQRMRRVGVLMNLASDDLEGQTRLAAFQQELQQLGWGVGENLRVDYRWAAGDPERFRMYAAELIALTPDVVLAITSPAVAALQQASNTVPIGLIVTANAFGANHPDLITAQATAVRRAKQVSRSSLSRPFLMQQRPHSFAERRQFVCASLV
jgi:putative tryptophan/tyrosine transport system substrate-binding protein